MDTTQKIAAGVVGSAIIAAGGFFLAGGSAASATPGYYAQVDANNVVKRVLVISQDQINTGRWGSPSSFIQTSDPASSTYAVVGDPIATSTGAAITPTNSVQPLSAQASTTAI